MHLQLPKPIEAFVRAGNAGDVESISDCFVPNATVRDEGRYYEGLPAIKAWQARARKKYNYTGTPPELNTNGGAQICKARLTGDFPGTPTTANFHFALVDDRIGSLQIRS